MPADAECRDLQSMHFVHILLHTWLVQAQGSPNASLPAGSGRNFTAYTFRRRLVGPSRGLDPLTPAAPKCTSPLADPAQAVNVNNGDKVVTLHLQVRAHCVTKLHA